MERRKTKKLRNNAQSREVFLSSTTHNGVMCYFYHVKTHQQQMAEKGRCLRKVVPLMPSVLAETTEILSHGFEVVIEIFFMW